jgi:ribonuclease-3
VNLENFQTLLDYQFKRLDLLEQALTHRSYAPDKNNERLEFLGDSVLNLVISQHVYQRRSDADEGELSRTRASLVKQEALARVARDIGLGDYIYLGGGELKSGGFRRSSILSDTLEAVIGAIYLDGGFGSAQNTVLLLYREYLLSLPDTDTPKDAKTRLQEYLQSRQLSLPEYAVTKTTGKSHNQIFTVTCSIASLQLRNSGEGSSRKKAEQNAADRTLDQLAQ